MYWEEKTTLFWHFTFFMPYNYWPTVPYTKEYTHIDFLLSALVVMVTLTQMCLLC